MQSSRLDHLDLSDRWILKNRGPRNSVDPGRPYAYFVEPERIASGAVEDVATVFLTNRECPFHCLMCDLWKNTTIERVPDGAIARQVEWALHTLPDTRHLKLYNSGSFFDAQAVPRAEWQKIAQLLRHCQTVVVESHPRFIDPKCAEFASLLEGTLQVAMGLETVDPNVLPRLNKRMTLADYEKAAAFLLAEGIEVRAFILLRTPFQNEEEGVYWAKRSIDHACSIGVECSVVIPTRGGNGAMDLLQREGYFTPPSLLNLEEVLDYGVGLRRGRVFADLWDIERLFDCRECSGKRVERMHQVNLSQEVIPHVSCSCSP